MKIHPVEAELFHADRRTDRHDEANSHFSQVCKRAYKVFQMPISSFTIVSVVGALLISDLKMKDP